MTLLNLLRYLFLMIFNSTRYISSTLLELLFLQLQKSFFLYCRQELFVDFFDTLLVLLMEVFDLFDV